MSETELRTTAGVADRLFDAIERGDITTVEQLFSPAVAVWKTGDERPSDRARSVRIIAWFINATLERRYEILDRQFFDGGFVQQHVLHATGRTDVLLAVRVCIVIKLDSDGLISSVDEYLDPAGIAPLLAAGR
ncbi:Uncharacterised protein [Mycolicibacterium vanbaalenii]|uniref:SnoaL-like domain-containing protein n=1 Tax=Mycolicibacterium vanbaalenii TaxID=110539 RepID=A0A5S9R4R1_MYCVN|nr:nuclear transport factor 2 family protein [Mycolicibacterium vanbaalenii]CAA0128532.1 Uncharacterised protein [Mycolicibacterium vanbaalenii]